jgi:hypothetical protein
MAKKIVAPVRISPKQKFLAYKELALNYIGKLRNPFTAPAFNVATYEKVLNSTTKRPNFLSAPELGAIVGTARQLGKEVRISLSGSGDEARLYFTYVDGPLDIPTELY